MVSSILIFTVINCAILRKQRLIWVWGDFHIAPTLCSLSECLKRPSGAPLAGSTQLQGISTARGIPLKLHQSDNSDHTKRQLGSSRDWTSLVSATTLPAVCAGSFVSSAVTGTERGQCKPTSELLKLKLICDRQSVGQFVWVSGLPMGPLTRFYLVLLFSADTW
jgi:hypothetical protein